jgi:hypothetical protein
MHKHFETTRFEEFRSTVLKDLDEIMWDVVQTDEFDQMISQTVRSMFPEHEHEEYIAHYRGLLKHWVDSENF